ncbi:hypothetical protein [Pseudomonas nitroreducens]|uniref:hypothetical protein n=1 Tax=Pseudomonas nitroreducens TaxID=46680 RepID=UPI003CC82316
MTEPASTAVGGIALYKLGAFGFFAILAAILVMAMTLPKTVREFVVSMTCTVVSSVCGGAFVVRWFDLGNWVQDDVGMVAICGIIFVCGLPAWVIVRAWFAWSEARKGVGLPELAREFRDGTGI